MSDLLHVSSSPHVRAKDDTSRIMLYVIIALLPTSLFGIFNFGPRALLLILVCIFTCVISEFLFEKITKRKVTVKDLSAVVTGLLLALNLPHTLPIWQAVVGSVFAIVVVKMLFGGLGQNFMNPALGGRVFMLVSFAATMTNFEFDGVASATPLAMIKSGESVNTLDLLIGRTGGTIGETSTLFVLIGAIILILLGVIDLTIPGAYIVSFVVFLVLFSGHGFDSNYIVAQLCGGGLMLGAFFMATDYVTSPITPMGKVLFGICLGVLTGLYRIFGNSAEGVSYAIIFSNLLVPLIEKITIPRAFGIVRQKKTKEVKANE
ncbi:MAG: RnfABCDGE type electron transport complex subunit D [Pseudobutyrivibrio sp.]|nr:RnfABCDGE type electron transport complex subunit D [Pseudobutyrivibrio sp.]